MDILPTLWFVLIAVLWTGYLFLEGFDLGVGMHMLVSARSETDRRVMLNTIGPVWDGNEVWLITAAGATFAAFPYWYASLFSAMYIPLVVVLAGLIFRAVAIEYRGKGTSARWIRGWTLALGIGSFVAAFGVGAMLALTTTGLPLDANGDRVGGAFAWFSDYAVLGGLAVVGFCLLHAATFLAIKTDGSLRERAMAFAQRWAPVAILPFAAWVVVVQAMNHKPLLWLVVVVAFAAALTAWSAARRGSEGLAFIGFGAFLVAGSAAIFANVYPVVLPSTLNSAWNLTVDNASATPYTLGVMSVVACIGLPLVLAYQGWTYWVFRRRISDSQLPQQTGVRAAVKQP